MNIKQHRFVTEYLKWGDKAIAYKNAYALETANYRTLESAANRLLQHPEIAAAIQEAQERIRSEVEEELKAALLEEMLTVQRKRAILARIAEGNIYIEQQYKGRDCKTCTQMVKPTINQMLKAIDLDSKLAGDYPVKKQMTVVHTAPSIPAKPKEVAVTNTTQEKVQPVKHITHAGLRKLLSTPVTSQKEILTE